MFDVGFWEIGLIAVVALLVVGPERLPGLARKVGLWVGKIRRFISSVQSEIDQELSKAEQLKKLIEDQKELFANHQIIDDEKPTVPVESQSLSNKNQKPNSANLTEEINPVKSESNRSELAQEVQSDLHHRDAVDDEFSEHSHRDEADDEFSEYSHHDEAQSDDSDPVKRDETADPSVNHHTNNGSHEKTNS